MVEPVTPPRTNWAGNVTFAAARVARPSTIEALLETVAGAARRNERVRAIGARHSFNRIIDVDGLLVVTDDLCHIDDVDSAARTVTVEGGIRYAELAASLHELGWALPNLPSLPHVSVAGAVATGTHGSGDRNRVLADAVASIDLVTAGGELVHVERRDADGPAVAVGLGAFGVVARVTLRLEPAFDVAQRVYVDVPSACAVDDLDALLASAYSVSLFTDWRHDTFRLLRKQRASEPDDSSSTIAGLTPAVTTVHPIRGMPVDACTEQLGRSGPWHERLPHFRAGAVPSVGEELQSEYFVERADASAALTAVQELAPRLAPLVLVSEVRSVAADDLWLSPAHDRDSVAFHFTWRPAPAAVAAMLPLVEAAARAVRPSPPLGQAVCNRRRDHPRARSAAGAIGWRAAIASIRRGRSGTTTSTGCWVDTIWAWTFPNAHLGVYNPGSGAVRARIDLHRGAARVFSSRACTRPGRCGRRRRQRSSPGSRRRRGRRPSPRSRRVRAVTSRASSPPRCTSRRAR